MDKYVRLSGAVRTILDLQKRCLEGNLEAARNEISLGIYNDYDSAVRTGQYLGLCDAYEAINSLEVFEL